MLRWELEPHEACDIGRQEHDRHFVVAGDRRSPCHGWHELHRDLTTTPATFHRPYLRGAQSNLVHKSAHAGQIIWFPVNFYKFGPATPVFWEVQVKCGRFLRNPRMLTEEQLPYERPLTAKSYSEKYPEVTSCAACFGSYMEFTCA